MKINTDHPVYVLAFTLAISAAFTAGIMALHVATAQRVERNESLRTESALVELFGLGDPATLSGEQVSRLYKTRIKTGEEVTDPKTGQRIGIIRAYDRPTDEPGAKLIGVAFPIDGMGFWAPIHGLMAVTPDGDKSIGVVFLSQSETPGLGARIDERRFRRQFKGLNVSPPAEGGRYVYVGGGKPTGPGDPRTGRRVDAFTGATRTSVAVQRLIDESIRRFRRAYPPTAKEDAP
jgi:Na+-transporting NADH:ubiquinone oxidoreductase subunit C